MRRAQIDVDFTGLVAALPIMRDHGLVLIGVAGPAVWDPFPICRLTLEGHSLPEFCEVPPLSADCGPLVTMAFTQRVYGEQKMVEISSIDLRKEEAHRAA